MLKNILLALGVVGVTVVAGQQQPMVRVVGPTDISSALAETGGPNPMSELAQGDGYRLTVRRRTQLDVASKHDRRTEVYHVLDGQATLVTGGALLSPKKIDDQGNSEGTGIDGGTSRVIGKGAVVVIEAGVPHTFSKIDQSIMYTTTWIFR
jgi:mannose-6-phosphate isomerase-like protein (cupin superfamily)